MLHNYNCVGHCKCGLLFAAAVYARSIALRFAPFDHSLHDRWSVNKREATSCSKSCCCVFDWGLFVSWRRGKLLYHQCIYTIMLYTMYGCFLSVEIFGFSNSGAVYWTRSRRGLTYVLFRFQNCLTIWSLEAVIGCYTIIFLFHGWEIWKWCC